MLIRSKLAICWIGLAVGCGGASAPETPPPGTPRIAAPGGSPVALDATALTSGKAFDLAIGPAPAIHFTPIKRKAVPTPGAEFTFVGESPGGGHAILVSDGKATIGTVFDGTSTFVLEGRGTNLVARLATTMVKPLHPAEIRSKRPERCGAPVDPPDVPIGVVVMYTQAVADSVWYGPRLLARKAIEETNLANHRSGIDRRFQLEVAIPTATVEEDPDAVIDEFTTDEAQPAEERFDEIHQARTDHNGDLAILLIKTDRIDWLGVARADKATVDTAFAVVSYESAAGPNYWMAHEIGHLMGAEHENHPSAPYECGHAHVENKQGTLMMDVGYTDHDRLLRWSTGDRTAADDNAKVLRMRWETVSKFVP